MINTKMKSASVLLITLILGIFLGFIIKSWFVEDRFERMGRMMRPGGLMTMIEKSADITQEQKEQLTPLIEFYRAEISTIGAGSRHNIRMLVDSLKSEIRKILTVEQFESLPESFTSKHRKESRRGSSNRSMKRDSTYFKKMFMASPDSISWREFKRTKMDSIKKAMYKPNN